MKRGSKDEGMRLGDIADVMAGAAMPRRSEAGAADFPVLRLSDLDEVTGALAPLDRLERMAIGRSAASDRAMLREGDVVMSCRGVTLRVGMVGPETVGAAASANFAVIRSRGQVDPAVIYALLRTEGAREVLRALERTGTAQASISFRDVANLAIRLPDPQQQARISELVRSHREHLRTAQATMAAREALVKGLLEEAVWGEGCTEGRSR